MKEHARRRGIGYKDLYADLGVTISQSAFLIHVIPPPSSESSLK